MDAIETTARKRPARAIAPALKIVPEDSPEIELVTEPTHPLADLSPSLIAMLAQASPAALIAIEAAAVAITGAAPAVTPAALPPAGVACMDLLASRPPYRGTKIEEMEAAIFSATRKTWSEKSIRRNLLPLLRAWGVVNRPGIGYSWPAHCRLSQPPHYPPTSSTMAAAA